MIADMLNNKKLVTESNSNKNYLLEEKKLNISLALINKYYFAVPKDIRVNSRNYFIMKISGNSFNKSQLITHQILSLKIL